MNIFTVTTRNHHDGKLVLELYYDCFREMALKELQKIAEQMLEKHDLKRIWISHRIGIMPIGEASIILAVSSAHRKDAFDATAEAMDLIKLEVPILKKEQFEIETVWKEEKLVKKEEVSTTPRLRRARGKVFPLKPFVFYSRIFNIESEFKTYAQN